MCAFEPWERKSDRFLISPLFFYYLLFFWQTTPVSAMPSPLRSPHRGALAAPWQTLFESPQSGGGSSGVLGEWGVDGGEAFSHPRVKYQLWRCEHTHCAYLLACTRTQRCRAALNFWELEKHLTHGEDLRVWTVYTGGWIAEGETQGAAEFGLSGCEELSCGVASVVAHVLFNWVCLLTSPAVVNCIKAVSGSMATFYNSYVNRERISKAQRISAGKESWDKTQQLKRKKKNITGEGSLVFSEMFQYNM